MRALRTAILAAVALAGCLRPLPEDVPDEVGPGAPDAGSHDPNPELDAFFPVPGAAAELKFVVLTGAGSFYVSDGTDVWVSQHGEAFSKVDLSHALSGSGVDRIGGLWEGPAYSDFAVAAVHGAGAWHLVALRDGTARWSRDFPGANAPAASANVARGPFFATSTDIVFVENMDTGQGATSVMPGNGPVPTLALGARITDALIFTRLESSHLAFVIPVTGTTPGNPTPLPEHPGMRLKEAQCGTSISTGVLTNSTAVLFETDAGALARFVGDETQGEWALLPADVAPAGRCLAARGTPGSAGPGSDESYVFRTGILLRQAGDGSWAARSFVGFTGSAAVAHADRIVIAGTVTASGQRGVAVEQ